MKGAEGNAVIRSYILQVCMWHLESLVRVTLTDGLDSACILLQLQLISWGFHANDAKNVRYVAKEAKLHSKF
jgi:hypothetical protein